MGQSSLKLTGNLQIEAAYSALRAAGAKPENTRSLTMHLKTESSPIDDLRGQAVRNLAIFVGQNGQTMRHLIMQGIERQLTAPVTSEEDHWRKVAAVALLEVLNRENQETP